MREVILASTSSYRRVLMDQLGIPYLAVAPRFEEIVDPKRSPRSQAIEFARGKAKSLAKAHPNALILGSDQIVVAEGRLVGKPGTVEAARAQLASLSGGRHELVTAVALLDARTEDLVEEVEIHHLAFRVLQEEEIARYVALDAPLDCSGTFKIESLGVHLFESIGGTDPTGVMGLPLIRVARMLRHFGVSPLLG